MVFARFDSNFLELYNPRTKSDEKVHELRSEEITFSGVAKNLDKHSSLFKGKQAIWNFFWANRNPALKFASEEKKKGCVMPSRSISENPPQNWTNSFIEIKLSFPGFRFWQRVRSSNFTPSPSMANDLRASVLNLISAPLLLYAFLMRFLRGKEAGRMSLLLLHPKLDSGRKNETGNPRPQNAKRPAARLVWPWINERRG